MPQAAPRAGSISSFAWLEPVRQTSQCVAALGVFACPRAVEPVIHISDEDVQVGTALRFGQYLRIAVGKRIIFR